MASARYFLPDHPTLTEVYSRTDLRTMLLAGTLSRSDMVLDDETGLAHLLGDLLTMPYPEVTVMPTRSTSGLQALPSAAGHHEFRADTPLPKPETEMPPDLDDEDYEDVEDEDASLMDDDFEDEDESADEAPDAEETRRSRPLQFEPLDDDMEDSDEEGTVAGAPVKQHGTPGPEELLYQAHPSWLAYPKGMLAALVAGTAAYFAHRLQFGMEWMLLCTSVAGLILLFVGLDRYTSTYYITTRRVEMEYGILGRNTKEVRIQDVRAIDVHQAGYAALVGLGTVKFDSSASAGPEVLFTNVRRPHDIKELVRELQG